MLTRVSISCLSTCRDLLSAAMSTAVAMVLSRTGLGGGGRNTSGIGLVVGRNWSTSGIGRVGGKTSCSLPGVLTCSLLPGVLSRLVEGVVTIGIGADLL